MLIQDRTCLEAVVVIYKRLAVEPVVEVVLTEVMDHIQDKVDMEHI